MKKLLRNSMVLLLVLACMGGYYSWDKYRIWNAKVGTAEPWCIEIPPGMNTLLQLREIAPQAAAVIEWRKWSIYPGRYCETGTHPAHHIARRIATGQRAEVALPVPSKRSIEEIAAVIAPRIWADSASIAGALNSDSLRWQIIPNTYRVYWECTAEDLAQRLVQESQKWWNAERLKKAWALGLSQQEVVTLASIVQEETARPDEAPVVAGLYLNRLKKSMLLQADPTLKFALGDWTIRRLLDEDKKIASPYNTYRNPGLPPGPIRIPEAQYIDAVLNAERHNYLYMCAKTDGSGTHAFARTYGEHMRNARAWQSMLNREKIYR